MPYNIRQDNTTQYKTKQNRQGNAMQYNRIHYNTIQYNRIHYTTLQYNTTHKNKKNNKQ